MRDLILQLRGKVIEASSRTGFLHHPWYVDYHLKIVQKISEELCDRYPEADRDVVRALVWIHDYGKTISFKNQHGLTISEGRKLLDEIGFPSDFSITILRFAALLDRCWEVDLSESPIEVQIVSSADGCSHLVGPFFYLWWQENCAKPFAELMEDNRRKLFKDWHRKIILPEARSSFEARYRMLLEQTGDIPSSFIVNNPPLDGEARPSDPGSVGAPGHQATRAGNQDTAD